MSYWDFPSNKDVFDLVKCIHEPDEIDQPSYKPARIGDTVFIYVTAPYGQLLYRMEITEIFESFQDERINKGRWLKYSGRGVQPRKGQWVRIRFVDNADHGYKPLQPQGLRMNDITTAAIIYPLTKAKAEYLLEQFDESKNKLLLSAKLF